MKFMSVIKVGEVYKGVLMCKASESSALSTPTVTLDDGNEITMTDGSVVIEVDTTASHILYDGKWYKNSNNYKEVHCYEFLNERY